ncbi:Fatty acid oxidation complex subunit alpha [Nymphon striatum]|nr:Fatty acid oxidation complex subunit alpha [Nymphon striatum]
MGLGPAHAIVETLKYHHLIMENIDYWEINEAFAAQVQACVLALNDSDYCKGELGLLKEAGQIPMDRLNVDGGAIALGHPVGSSGARIVLHLAHVLKRENAKKGIASLCIGGGQDELVWLTLDVKDEAANVINPDVVEELSAACDEVKTMSGIKGMIIHSGKTSGFIAGADVKKFTEVTDTTQALGGLEIALACDYIVTDDAPSTKLSLPEVKLGIHPGFGGTVRSIRRMGVLAAMPLMLTGRNVLPRQAKSMGLTDMCVPLRQLKASSIQTALRKPPKQQAPKSSMLLEAGPMRKLVAMQMRKQVASKAKQEHYPAPYALINIWEMHGSKSDEMFTAEAEVSLGDKSLFSPKHVHVIGGGVMGGDIAAWCAMQGFKVTIQDLSQDALGRVVGRAVKGFKRRYRKDKFRIMKCSR